MTAVGTQLDFQACFGPIVAEPLASFVGEAEKIEREVPIEGHPFFAHTLEYPPALVLWASQEAVVTNPFSQAVFATLSNIENVHIRAILMPVIEGEHGTFDAQTGLAPRSHPWLVSRLCNSLGIPDDAILATSAVIDFIDVLYSATDKPMRSLGLLGVGNELLLLSEYGAIYKSFEKHFPEALYSDFLRSNIVEDQAHTTLIERAATALYNLGHPAEEYLAGARIGVNARLSYYDALLTESQRIETANAKGQ